MHRSFTNIAVAFFTNRHEQNIVKVMREFVATNKQKPQMQTNELNILCTPIN